MSKRLPATLRRKGHPDVMGSVIFACPTYVVMVVDGQEQAFQADFTRDARLIWTKEANA